MSSVHRGAASDGHQACLDRLRARLASNLRRLREAAKLSQAQLAERAGIAPRYLVQLERGEAANPSLRLIAGLSQALGVDATELLQEAAAPVRRPRGRPKTRE